MAIWIVRETFILFSRWSHLQTVSVIKDEQRGRKKKGKRSESRRVRNWSSKKCALQNAALQVNNLSLSRFFIFCSLRVQYWQLTTVKNTRKKPFERVLKQKRGIKKRTYELSWASIDGTLWYWQMKWASKWATGWDRKSGRETDASRIICTRVPSLATTEKALLPK